MGEFDSDSENSDNEGGMGNLNRLVIRPPGHSGKAKKGHLCFDASFETGRVDLVNEYEYDLFIRPDTCNPRSRFWFYFTVDNTKVDQRVIFNLVNMSKGKNLFDLGMTPLIKSSSRPKWQRIPRKYIFYFKSPEHYGHQVLSIFHGFDREEDTYHFAFSYPFSYSRCQAHLALIEQHGYPFFKRELLAHSIQKRRIDLITITNPENSDSGEKQRVVIFLSRVHPGDSPTSFVVQGILDFLISNHPVAVCLRDIIVFKIVPMLNPDGVFLGNHRSNLLGCDLNRNWDNANEWAHPALFALKQIVSEFASNKRISLDFIIDLHANTTLPGVFVYGNTYDDVYRYERHIVFPKLLAQNTEDFDAKNTMFNRDYFKSGTARRAFCTSQMETTNCYSLEVSFYGYKKPDALQFKYYTEDSYMRLGRNILRTCLDYYQLVGGMLGPIAQTLGGEWLKNRRKVHKEPAKVKLKVKKQDFK